MKIINYISTVFSLYTEFPTLYGLSFVCSYNHPKHSCLKTELPIYSHYKTPDIWQLGKNNLDRFGACPEYLLCGQGDDRRQKKLTF